MLFEDRFSSSAPIAGLSGLISSPTLVRIHHNLMQILCNKGGGISGNLTTKLAKSRPYASAPGSFQTALCIRRTRTDADGSGRTRTEADGRGRTRTDADIFIKLYIFFFFPFCCCWHTLIYGANWNETQSPTVWVTPPPPHAS